MRAGQLPDTTHPHIGMCGEAASRPASSNRYTALAELGASGPRGKAHMSVSGRMGASKCTCIRSGACRSSPSSDVFGKPFSVGRVLPNPMSVTPRGMREPGQGPAWIDQAVGCQQ